MLEKKNDIKIRQQCYHGDQFLIFLKMSPISEIHYDSSKDKQTQLFFSDRLGTVSSSN
jgi:hypothetical protein